MSKITKVSIGKDTKKRSHFDLTHTNTTTFSIGAVQPLFCKELAPNTEMSVSTDSFVRLSPMVAPTFGKLSMRTYNAFVPMEEIYHPWASLLAEKTYNGAKGSYIPTQVPHVRLGFLWQMVMSLGAEYSIWHGAPLSSSTSEYYDSSISGATLVDGASTDFRNTLISAFNGYYGYNIPDSTVGVYNIIGSTETSGVTNYIRNVEELNKRSAEKKLGSKRPTVTPEGADFIFSVDYSWPTSSNPRRAWFCFRLGDAAARVRKILVGLGYACNPFDNTRVSILPLLAYYKAWFDLFMPQRDMVTWENTDIYRLIEYIELEDMVQDAFCADPDNTSPNRIVDLFAFKAVMKPLANTFYTDNTDYVSAHRDKLTLDSNGTANLNVQEPTPIQPAGVVRGSNSGVTAYIGEYSKITRVGLELLNKMTKYVNKNSVIGGKIDNYLRTHYNSAFLSELDSNYIGSSEINIQIGDVYSTTENAQILNGENVGAALGEYAGKGVGFGSGNKMHFTSKVFGYWITLAVVVPQVSYVQALNRNNVHLSKFDFFSEEFDAIGMQVDNFNKIQGTRSVSTKANDEHKAFGVVPRFSEYKNQLSTLNGDCSLRSVRDSFQGYYLDRIISENDIEVRNPHMSGDTSVYDVLSLVNNSSRIPMADTEWKTVGKYHWLGNYNRIFVDGGVTSDDLSLGNFYSDDTYLYLQPKIDDKFICHNVINVDMFAPMLSMRDSFDTDAQDSGLDVELQ